MLYRDKTKYFLNVENGSICPSKNQLTNGNTAKEGGLLS